MQQCNQYSKLQQYAAAPLRTSEQTVAIDFHGIRHFGGSQISAAFLMILGKFSSQWNVVKIFGLLAPTVWRQSV